MTINHTVYCSVCRRGLQIKTNDEGVIAYVTCHNCLKISSPSVQDTKNGCSHPWQDARLDCKYCNPSSQNLNKEKQDV